MTISREVKAQIITLHRHTSKNQREIATELNISQTTVSKVIKIWSETGSIEDHSEDQRGPKYKLDAREVRKLRVEAKKDPRRSAREIQAAAGPVAQTLSVRTIQRYLHRDGLKSYRPQKVAYLTDIQKKRRLSWAKDMKNMAEDFWDEVSFKSQKIFNY